MANAVEEAELVLDGVRVFYRRVPGDGIPAVYCHGNPTHSGEWLPFLERGGAAIAIDMPGWGRSDRPEPERFDYTMHGLAAFLDRCLDELGIGSRRLVVHDWGSLALIAAQRRPELVERLVVIDGVALLPGYRWHWVAQIWRRRPLGEISNALATRSGTALVLRQARGDRSAMPAEFVDMIWDRFDSGTRRAVLSLYRDADPERLAAAGAGLARLDCPALVLWGARDPYVGSEWGRRFADVLPNARLEVLEGAGHWPWIDDPTVIDRVLDFVGTSAAGEALAGR